MRNMTDQAKEIFKRYKINVSTEFVNSLLKEYIQKYIENVDEEAILALYSQSLKGDIISDE